LSLQVNQQAAAQGEGQRHSVIRNLGRAVVGHIQNHNLPAIGGDAVDGVVANAHAADGAQLGETLEVLGGDAMTQGQQAVGGGAVLIRQIGDTVGDGRRKDDPDVGAEDAPFHAVVGVRLVGVEDGEGHGVFLFFIQANRSANAVMSLTMTSG
jgi:hypothetical protein